MNIEVLNRTGAAPQTSSRLMIADGDIHPRPARVSDLHPWLSKQMQEVMETFGTRARHGWEKGSPYPKMQPMASRRDAWPKTGGGPASDLTMLREQLLDLHNVELGIMNPLAPSGQGLQNTDLSIALTRAVNEWQVAAWASQEPRLKASVVVPFEDGAASAREIRHWAGNKHFAQVLLLSRTNEPLGQRRYWPIYEAAQEAGLPVGIHAFGYGGAPVTSSGWASYYGEEMIAHSMCAQAGLTSMVMEGVFERFPKLKVISIEAGVSWAPALMWRLDAQWKKLRAETPHLKLLPSEYLRRQVWWTTQPIEEPEPREKLVQMLDWLGWDRLIFATDYPHWDFDDPNHAFAFPMSEANKRALFRENARGVYGF